MTQNLVSPMVPADAALLDLGVVLGQTQAFGVVTGKCSAAQALGSSACARRGCISPAPRDGRVAMLFNSALSRVREELARVALENGLA